MKNEPEIIYLQIGENADVTIDNEINDFDELLTGEISWSDSKIFKNDILYRHYRYTPYVDRHGQSIHIGDKLRKWLTDLVEPTGGFWWYATVEFWRGCLVLMEVGYDPENYDLDENFPSLLHQEIAFIEIVKKYYEIKN